MKYADEMKGLSNFIVLFHNLDRRQDHYNNWNFTSSIPWDGDGLNSFSYNLNTTKLAQSEKYIIGKETIDKVSLNL